LVQGVWYHDIPWKEGSWRPALLNKWSAFICCSESATTGAKGAFANRRGKEVSISFNMC
jgi:hypothetical protein